MRKKPGLSSSFLKKTIKAMLESDAYYCFMKAKSDTNTSVMIRPAADRSDTAEMLRLRLHNEYVK